MLSLQNQILLFLASNGDTSKKSLRLPFDNVSNAWFSQKYRQLLKSGMIEEISGKSTLRVRLTRKGIAYVREQYPDWPITKNIGKNQFSQIKRKETISLCRTVFSGAGVCVSGRRKPSLIDLASSDDVVRSAAESLFDSSLKNGLFYTSSEIKSFALHLSGANDVFYGARMAGLLVLRNDVFYVYGINKKLSRAYTSVEAKLIEAIGRYLSEIPAFSRYANRLSARSRIKRCLIVGNPRGTLTKIYYGTGHGIDTLPGDISEAAMKRLNRWKASHITYANLSELFSSIFFVSGTSAGVQSVKVINSAAGNYSELTQKITWNLRLTPTGACRELCWDPESETNIIPMPYIDMIEMDEYYRYLRSGGQTATIIAPRAYKDPLSRCFRETIGNFIDIDTMQEEHIYHYLEDGTAAGESYMRGLKYTKFLELEDEGDTDAEEEPYDQNQ